MSDTMPKRPRARPQLSEGAQLTSRLLRCLPAATFEMETLCRLAGIRSSRDIPTAAVECRQRPNMLLNPDFVARFCQRDEHLFLLVMHELWHIILAHTRLYPRVTTIHNIAFDAIINAGLARQFTAPEYRGFFEALNPPDKFPGMLLRPPVGWPENTQYPPDDTMPRGTRSILERLYPPHNQQDSADPLYEELLDLLRKAGMGAECLVVFVDPVLLGDHDDPEREARALGSPVLRDMLRDMLRKWPRLPVSLGREAGPGGALSGWSSDVRSTSENARRAFGHTLRRCLGPQEGSRKRKARSQITGTVGMGVLPNARERMIPARKQLGAQGMLWNQTGEIRARVPEKPSRAHIYLDVSGSMAQLLPHLLGMLLPYVRSHQAVVFQFSNFVEAMPLADLQNGKLRSSGGTDINCVLRHALDTRPRITRALIVTDGYTGFPQAELASRVQEENLRIYAVLPAEMAVKSQIASVSTQIIILPPLNRSTSPWRI
jgi:hypothetical protein